MKINSFQGLVGHLQKQPYDTRVRIMWGTVGIVAVILFVLWVLNLKSTISHLDTSDLIKSGATQAASIAQVSYAAVERVEISGNILKLYFNFNNPSDDILNISKLSDISILVGGKQVTPTQMTDRQGQQFVRKVLSHTQNFGILTFPETDGNSAELSFNQMFFEKTPDQVLSQKIDLDLKKLQTKANLRN
ncbi:MAG: hypothetical protein ABI643_04070 [Candidatus Doudnabacteria bacterium]